MLSLLDRHGGQDALVLAAQYTAPAMAAAHGTLLTASLRAAFASPRAAFLVLSSILALAGLFVASWLIFMPVGALVVAPLTLALSLLSGTAPSAFLNTAAAVLLSGSFAAATVTAAFRVLLRRARARRRAALAT